MSMNNHKPLNGIRVIEVGQLLAGPFTGCILAYFGAEVIKIEPPGGDPIRGWREVRDGTSLWWYSLGRNKKSITLDLNNSEGQALARQLIERADVLVENFRPGVMENWALGPEQFKTSNAGLVYARISGYGQTGPYASKPGYASVTEGISGFRFLNGYPEQTPVRPNLSIGDTIAGIHTALGIAMALLERHHSQQGQVVDVALYEAMFNLMEAVVPEYDGAGIVRQASGSTVTGIVPTNTYRCQDAKYVVIGGNGDSIFKRLMHAAGHPEMAENPAMADNSGRVKHENAIDEALARWCSQHDAAEIIALLEEARVPVGPIYNAADMLADPHFQARGLFEQVEINGQPLKIPAIMPKLARTPGGTDWPGPELGEHTEHVLDEVLGLDPETIAALRANAIV